MSQIIPRIGDPARHVALLNAIRHLRGGGKLDGVYLGEGFGRAILQEISGVDLGAEPLPVGMLTETDLRVYQQRVTDK